MEHDERFIVTRPEDQSLITDMNEKYGFVGKSICEALCTIIEYVGIEVIEIAWDWINKQYIGKIKRDGKIECFAYSLDYLREIFEIKLKLTDENGDLYKPMTEDEKRKLDDDLAFLEKFKQLLESMFLKD